MTTREACWYRDVPRSCHCRWQYLTHPARWVRTRAVPGCPWHLSAEPAA
jgi:hypothetical protein